MPRVRASPLRDAKAKVQPRRVRATTSGRRRIVNTCPASSTLGWAWLACAMSRLWRPWGGARGAEAAVRRRPPVELLAVRRGRCVPVAPSGEIEPDRMNAVNIKNLFASMELTDAEQEASPVECSICLEFLCSPLTLGCGHSFCRLCLTRCARHRGQWSDCRCPLCRSARVPRLLSAHLVDAPREKAIVAAVGEARYSARLLDDEAALAELDSDSALPIFAMAPSPRGGAQVGQVVALNLFEPRYKLLARRTWVSTSREFVFMDSPPGQGSQGQSAVVVRMETVAFRGDGKALVIGRGVRAIRLGEVWVEPGTGGLHLTRERYYPTREPRPAATGGDGDGQAGTARPPVPFLMVGPPRDPTRPAAHARGLQARVRAVGSALVRGAKQVWAFIPHDGAGPTGSAWANDTEFRRPGLSLALSGLSMGGMPRRFG